jgi:hypothetical protein
MASGAGGHAPSQAEDTSQAQRSSSLGHALTASGRHRLSSSSNVESVRAQLALMKDSARISSLPRVRLHMSLVMLAPTLSGIVSCFKGQSMQARTLSGHMHMGPTMAAAV